VSDEPDAAPAGAVQETSGSYFLGSVSQFPAGSRRIVQIRGHSIGVFNVDGVFYALLNRCPHQGGPLCEGQVLSRLDADTPETVHYDPWAPVIECPWHAWAFDLATGRSSFDPAKTRVRSYRVTREMAGEAEAPYKAETIPVAVKEEQVVLTLRGGFAGRRPNGDGRHDARQQAGSRGSPAPREPQQEKTLSATDEAEVRT
jgi:nitrite reductase/ring-hydroxylating ferredoxin subunit